MDTFIGAMAHWQLGKKAEARTAFEADSEWLKGYEQRYEADRKEKGDGYKIPLPVWLKRLRADAAAMLGVTRPTVEPAPEPTTKVEEAQKNA